MRTVKAITLTLLGAFLLVSTGAINAQDIRLDDSAFQLKSEATAQRYSLFGTLIPIGMGLATHDKTGAELALAGIVVGPSLGYFYGGKPGRGLAGIGVRVGIGAASLIIGNEMGLEVDIFGTGEADDEGWPIVIIGTALVIGHAISDIASVKNHIRERNDELIYENRSSVTLTPKYFADSGAGGLQLSITF